MVELDGEGPFKRPGAVPFNWEIRPGIPKIRAQLDDDGPTLLQPPKKLSPLLITKLPPSPPSSSPTVSPFAPPPPPPSSFKPKPRHSSGGPPPSPYWRSSSARGSATTALRQWSRLKSLLRFKKSKTRDNVKNTTTMEADVFYDAETTFPSSESSLSSSYFRTKRNESDLSSSEKRIILMMERDRLNWDVS